MTAPIVMSVASQAFRLRTSPFSSRGAGAGVVDARARELSVTRRVYHLIGFMKRVARLAFLLGVALASSLPARAAVDRARLEEAIGKYDGKSVRPMGPEVLPVLVSMYEEGDESRREQIAAIFYQLGWKSADAKRVLMRDAKTQNQALRMHVQYALGRVSNDDDVVDVLLDNMQHDSSPLFRDKAACSLAYDQIHLTPRQKARLYEGLIGALSSPEPQVRAIALQALQIQTGQTKGFNPNASPGERSRAIDAWRRWLVEYKASV
jgi:hypothetical protein